MADPPSGAPAPTFHLPRLDGQGSIDGPSTGSLTMLLFYKASCPTCRWAMPFFQQLHDRTQGGSLSVIGLAQGEAEDERAFAEELGVTFPVALEETPWATSAAYGLTTVPTFFLVDEAGNVLLASPGFARDELRDVARRAAERDGGPAADPFPEGMEVPVFRPG